MVVSKKLDKLSVGLPYDSFSKFKEMTLKVKPKLDDYQIAKMFIKANIILHMPELTRTDEFSIGKIVEHGESKLN